VLCAPIGWLIWVRYIEPVYATGRMWDILFWMVTGIGAGLLLASGFIERRARKNGVRVLELFAFTPITLEAVSTLRGWYERNPNYTFAMGAAFLLGIGLSILFKAGRHRRRSNTPHGDAQHQPS